MQTNAIQRSAQRPVDIKAWLTGKAQSLSGWYNSRSEFYSRIAGFGVTRKTAIMVNIVALLLGFTAFVAAKEPLAALVSAAAAAWMVGRIDKANSKRKGGRK